MWFLHDGAPPHVSRVVREHLDQAFPHRWIGRRGPVNWPPRSPDLNPVDFYVWGDMKNKVYCTEVPSVDDLRERIFQAAEDIRNNREVLARVRRNWLRRSEACILSQGSHFEHLL